MTIYEIDDEESARIKILKILLCIFVVVYHSYEFDVSSYAVSDIVYPMWLRYLKEFVIMIVRCCNDGFIIISSILLYRKEFKWVDNLKKKIKTVLIPYVLANATEIILVIIYHLVLYKEFCYIDEPISWWLNAFGIGTQFPFTLTTWFLRNLFVLNVFSILIKRAIDFNPKLSLTVLILTFLFIETINCYYLDIEQLCFWCIGYYIVKYNIDLKSLDNNQKVPLYFILLLIINMLLTINGYEGILSAFFLRQLSFACVIFLYAFTTKKIDKGFKRLLLKLYENNYIIFVFHPMLLNFLQRFSYNFFGITAFTNLVCINLHPIIIIVVLSFFSYLFKKIFPKYYSIYTGSR